MKRSFVSSISSPATTAPPVAEPDVSVTELEVKVELSMAIGTSAWYTDPPLLAAVFPANVSPSRRTEPWSSKIAPPSTVAWLSVNELLVAQSCPAS